MKIIAALYPNDAQAQRIYENITDDEFVQLIVNLVDSVWDGDEDEE